MSGRPFVLVPCLWFWLVVLFLSATSARVEAARFSKVVIDAGHGGHDTGAKIGYIYEKHLALDVARRLERYLASKGMATVMTRSNDSFVSLENRAAIANKTRDSVMVSIHFNKVSYSGPTGTETWYYTRDGYSMASFIQQGIVAGLGAPNRGMKFGRFKVLRLCSRPAVLVEGGFISSTQDLKRCLDPKYRERLAASIGDALLRYRKS